MRGLRLSNKAKDYLKELPVVNAIDRLSTDDISILRSVVYEMNLKEKVSQHPDKAMKTSELFGLILLGDIYQNLFERYRNKNSKDSINNKQDNFEESLKTYFFGKNPSLKNFGVLYLNNEIKDAEVEGTIRANAGKYFGTDNEKIFDIILNPIQFDPSSIKDNLNI